MTHFEQIISFIVFFAGSEVAGVLHGDNVGRQQYGVGNVAHVGNFAHIGNVESSHVAHLDQPSSGDQASALQPSNLHVKN